MNLEEIRALAKINGYTEIDYQPNSRMISFTKKGNRINIYYTTMTVGTCIKHPKKGKTQLFRKKVDKKLLNMIFINPRIHTNKGYRKKQ